MGEFIQNPRKSPRAPARCHATVVSAHGSFEAMTDDVGGRGCQLISPQLVRKGEPIQLVVSHEAVKDSLRVTGRVAWCSDRAPWRLGVAYDESTLAQTQTWFEGLLAHVPGLAAVRRVPERIPLDTVLYLASTPRFLVDFTPDEVALLRSIGSGISIAEIRALLRDHWPQVQRALFSLLAHQHITLSRGGSVHPDAWRKILSDAESSLAVESMNGPPASGPTPPPAAVRVPEPPPAAPARAPPAAVARPPSPTAPVVPAPVEAAPAEEGAPDEPADWLVPAADMMPVSWHDPTSQHQQAAAQRPTAEPRGTRRGLDGGASWDATPPPLPAGEEAPPSGRSKEAQECYERALAELVAGGLATSTALLRRALVLAPGDAEISGALSRVLERQRK
jgi:hypothetical protein